MKMYKKPELETIEFETVDVIQTSTLVNAGEGSEGNEGKDDGIVEWSNRKSLFS